MTDDYKKIKPIGQGGMGEVWLISDTKTRGLYAAKFLHKHLARDKDFKRFEREINVLSHITHENLIKVLGRLSISGIVGYVMEYCPDGNIADHLAKTTEPEIFDVIFQLAKAVDFLHSQNFIHRDIKPQNILIAPDGNIRLSDFGLVVETEIGREIVTSSNWTSAGFAPPEQYIDMARVTKQGDIFSIGAVLYYLLTKNLFDISLPLEDQIYGLSPVAKLILRKSLTIRPEDRFASASKIVDICVDSRSIVMSGYFNQPPKDRQEYLHSQFDSCFDQKDWIDGRDIMALASVDNLLKDVIRFEDDDDIRKWATETLEEIENNMREIANEMEQDNPSY